MFAHVGNVGTNAIKRSGAVVDFDAVTSVTLTSDVPVGQLLVAFFGTTLASNPASLNHPTLPERMAFHDSEGNLWSTLVGHAQAGDIMGAIAATRVSRALSAGDTLDVTHRVQISNGQGTAACSVEQFDCDPDLRWAVYYRKSGNYVGAGTDPAGVANFPFGSFDGREYLILHLLVARGPNSDAYTWDSDYTEITGDGTTGGADADNIHVRGGFRILTSSGQDTIDVTSDTADRNTLEQVCALTEVFHWDEFPQTAILDDFNRADEDPVSFGGRWISADSAGPSQASPPSLLQVDGNQARGNSAGASPGGGGSWWPDEDDGGPDGEVHARIAVPGRARVRFNGSGAAENSTDEGVESDWIMCGANGGATPNHIADNLNVGLSAGLMTRTWVDIASGHGFGLQRLHPDIHQWIDRGDGWEWVAATHYKVADAGFDAGGYLGLCAFDSTTELDDFGGGPFPMWEIMRRTAGRRG